MAQDDRLQIGIEIDLGASPISGRFCAEGNPQQPFTGWTELFSALDKALSNARNAEGFGELASADAPAGNDPRA